MSLELPPPLPPFETVLGAIDGEARRTARAAGNIGLAAVRRTLPARSGRLRRGQRVRISRTARGLMFEVSPTSRVKYPNGVTAVQVTRWVDQGTGLKGPRHRLIRPRTAKAFHLPAGYRTTALEGQAPQHAYDRARSSSDALVERELAAGAQRAAREAERVYGGRR
jgi:hypothetical protein